MRRLITVVAREGIRLPMEGQPRSYIDTVPRQVSRTPYYLRAIRDGDIVLVEPPSPQPRAGRGRSERPVDGVPTSSSTGE